MKTQLLLMVPVVLAAGACASPAPVATNFGVSFQKVARTAHHWDVVAEDVVGQTMRTIAGRPDLQNRGVHVATARSTAFNTAFREFMITHLVDRGASVSVCKVGHEDSPGFAGEGPDVEVQYDSQLIVHGSRTPDYMPGRLTLLGAGVAVLRNAARSGTDEVNAAIIGTGAVADFIAGHVARPTRTEVIVTTTIIERNRFVARRSDIYYVPDADARLFAATVAQRSACPDGESVASAERKGERSEAEVEVARREMHARAMRRINPLWRPNHDAAYSF